jgi:predicted amidohydrolase
MRSIAVAQTIPAPGDVERNLEEHLHLARLASGEHAKIVVFPELSLTGYELELAPSLAFSERDTRLAPLVETARSGSVTVIAGAPALLDGRLHIGAFIISPDGVIEIYTKRHLGAFSPSDAPDGVVPPPEPSFFEPGDRDPLVPLGGGFAAVAICADAGRPAHAEHAAGRGATTYLASMFVIPSALESDTTRLRDYALRHSLAVAFSNYGGPTGGLAAAGRSAIWSERGELLAELEPACSGVVVAVEGPQGWRAKTLVTSDRHR